MKFLFLARTDDNNFFLSLNPKKKGNKWLDKIPHDIDLMVKNEVQKHKHIRIKFWENLLLFISDSWFSFIVPHKFWTKKRKLLKLLREGRKRIEKELDIVKIMIHGR